ncbi:MAG: response regulator [Cyanobacteriota bacterium]|nr:response regulator [Cyanobacteriota bacterium]
MPTLLIADDSITIRELLSMMLTQKGYQVETARDGQEAWEKLKLGFNFDLVLCDIEMPRMDGFALLERMKQDRALCNIPIAMLSSRGSSRMLKPPLWKRLGAAYCFSKPYSEEEILVTIALILNPTMTSILIVDDSRMVRELLSMMLINKGYQVIKAQDGRQAWKKFESGFKCDLILVDLEMPGMNGYELLAKLQQNSALQKIPVVIISGHERERIVNSPQWHDLKAQYYFTKSHSEVVLLEMIAEILQK